MNSVKRLVKNTISMIIARGLQPFLSLALVLAIGRILGPELFGKYTVVFELYFIFQIISSFGLRMLITREVAAQNDKVNNYLVNGTIISIATSLLSIVTMIIIVNLLNYDSEIVTGIYIVSISLIASSLTEVFSGILAGFEDILKIAYGWIIFLILKTVISIIVLFAGFGLIEIIIVHVVTKFLQPVIYYYFILKLIKKPLLVVNIDFCKKLLAMAWRLALLVICVSVFWRADAIMLSKLTTNEVVGNYGAAFKIFWFTLLVVRSFFIAFFPLVSSMFIEQKENFQKACRKAIRYLIILIIPMTLLISFFAPYFISLIWGNKYNSSALVLQVMIWTLVPFSITEVFGSALVASKNEMINLVLNTITLIIKLILNYFLILKYGIVGPAIATVIALICLMVMQTPYVIPELISLKFRTLVAPFVKIIIASFVMLVIIFLLNKYNIAIGIIVPGFVYFISLFILRIFSDEDRYYITKLLKKS